VRSGLPWSVAAATIGSLLFAAAAGAAPITVTSPADPAGTSSECTLRQALESANTDLSPVGSACAPGAGADTITFDPAILPNTIVAAGLGISSNVTIQGPGIDELTVNGNDAGRVFHVTSGTATISGLVIEDGRVTMPSAGPDGGAGVAVDVGAALTLDHTSVVGNTAVSNFNGGTIPIAVADGAGILSSGGDLTVRDTTVMNNSLSATAINGDLITIAVARGAGIAFNNGILVIDRSTFSGNTASATATDDGDTSTETRGGAITIFQNGFPEDPDASITSTTVVDNSLSNSNSAGGSATQSGGGIYTNEPTALTSGTVTGNSASEGSNIDVDTNDGSMTMRNTIVAAPASGDNCSDVGSAGYNFSSDASCDPTETGDVQNGDPNLLPLGGYGGPTQTRPPAPPSPGNEGVIDLGINSTPTLTTDQRGLDRTWDFDIADGTDGDGTDIGAVEIQGPYSLGTDPASPGDDDTPSITGSVEPASEVSLFAGASCGGVGSTEISATAFASPGFSVGPLTPNTATTFTTQSFYGSATSDCSDPVTYQRRPELPALTSTNPPSGSDNNAPKLIGTATASSTVNLYTQAGCTGPLAGTGSGADLAGLGIAVSVPDNSTTTFYAQATGVGGTSACSTGLGYTETTPPPPVATPAETGERAAALKKCKKKKRKLDWSKKRYNKCKRQANLLPV
jgi:hypothetical protein